MIAPPKSGSGKVLLKLCQPDGSAGETLFTKRDGDAFKAARRLDWGDTSGRLRQRLAAEIVLALFLSIA